MIRSMWMWSSGPSLCRDRNEPARCCLVFWWVPIFSAQLRHLLRSGIFSGSRKLPLLFISDLELRHHSGWLAGSWRPGSCFTNHPFCSTRIKREILVALWPEPKPTFRSEGRQHRKRTQCLTWAIPELASTVVTNLHPWMALDPGPALQKASFVVKLAHLTESKGSTKI